MINYGKQYIDDDDINEVISILKSDFLTQGPTVSLFEQALSKKVGAKYGVASTNGTTALHLACLALDLKKGDILWTVPNTFVASANCARYCGAGVDFVDINPVTWNISVDKLEEKLILAKKENILPKVLVPVHFSGQPTELERIWELSNKYGFKIIEDASHALGANRNGEPVGSCKWSDLSIFSFHPVKMITTAEGGMVLTNNSDLDKTMRLLASHGIKKSAPGNKFNLKPSYYYEQIALGYNYRITDIQAALGISQLKKLDTFVDKRNELALVYQENLKNLPIDLPTILPNNYSSFHIFVIRIKKEFLQKKPRDLIYQELIDHGIGVNLHYLPVHLHPYYQNLGFQKGEFIESEEYAESALTIPLYVNLTNSDQDRVISALKETLR